MQVRMCFVAARFRYLRSYRINIGGLAMRKVALTSTAVLMLGFSGLASAQSPSTTLETEYLMTLDLTFGALNNVGQRISVDVPSGQIRGPKISGTFVPPGGDWPLPMPDGSLRLDVSTKASSPSLRNWNV
jgi:hypothetical protein